MSSQARNERVLEFVLQTLGTMRADGNIPDGLSLTNNSPLIGNEAVLDSRGLVELLVALDDFMEEEFGTEFDWTSDKAMSARNSPFRTPQHLAEFAVGEADL